MLNKDAATLHNFSAASACEWIETNGLGGWSSSSVIGCHTRRYHGLLVASTQPPTERMLLVSKLDETICCGNERYELGTNNYGDAIFPAGYQHMTDFSKGYFPKFTYSAGGVVLEKTIAMVQRQNTVLVLYDVIKADSPFTLELLPLIAARYYHSLTHANDVIQATGTFANDTFSTTAYNGTPEIFIQVPGATYEADPHWYYNFHYSAEQQRGLDYTEDLYSPGKFSIQLKEGDALGIIVSVDDPASSNAHTLFEKELSRKKLLRKEQPAGDLMQQLQLAADQFIVKRNMHAPGIVNDAVAGMRAEAATVIAGYHWFTDWSRDTMISLPGLALSTGRYEDAKKILTAFAGSLSMGMLPNRFSDKGGVPEYNTVDGTLWYFVAVYKYFLATGDGKFVLCDLLPVLKNIIAWHFKGTRYNIHATEDGLLYAGESGQQLTWMDAKVDDWVVTPRMGRPVEIQSLWYNALKIFAELLQANRQQEEAATMNAYAEKARLRFIETYWYAAGNYLYDNIDQEGNAVTELRPNQLFAISLPFALLDAEQAAAVLQVITTELYTSVGLRSLGSGDPQYKGTYNGDRYKRDGAYHQGTVWSWLLGPYIDALIKVHGDEGRATAKTVIEKFSYHLNEACIGSVSEIFDGDAPHLPKGCVAQAWGVAEVLRVMKDYGL